MEDIQNSEIVSNHNYALAGPQVYKDLVISSNYRCALVLIKAIIPSQPVLPPGSCQEILKKLVLVAVALSVIVLCMF